MDFTASINLANNMFCVSLSLSLFFHSNAYRGSKQDMQAAATANAEYVGDEQAILESEQQYP